MIIDSSSQLFFRLRFYVRMFSSHLTHVAVFFLVRCCVLLTALSFSFLISLPSNSVFLYLYSSLTHSISLFLTSYQPPYPSLTHLSSLSLHPSLHSYSSVSVLAVKTKTIPVWDEALAARVRDGMTLQGTYVHHYHYYSYTVLYSTV